MISHGCGFFSLVYLRCELGVETSQKSRDWVGLCSLTYGNIDTHLSWACKTNRSGKKSPDRANSNEGGTPGIGNCSNMHTGSRDLLLVDASAPEQCQGRPQCWRTFFVYFCCSLFPASPVSVYSLIILSSEKFCVAVNQVFVCQGRKIQC